MNEIAKPLQIGDVCLDARVILAPMAGVCDIPYRLIARAHGAALVCTEMVSDKGLLYHNERTQEMLALAADEHPVSLQIFGSDPTSMARAAEAVERAGADIVDINMGCPVKKVVKNGSGAALLLDLPRAEAIIKAVVGAVHIPVTVKMRTGWDDRHIVAPELAKRAQAAGAAAVAVHGRTREALYSGTADWSVIKDVVAAVTIPVIGNGDIRSGPTAVSCLEQTGCAAVMIARAAQGNPWIFSQVNHYISTGKEEPLPTPVEKYKQMLAHFEALLAYKGEYIGIREMRTHASWYTRGLHGAAALRERINRTRSAAAFRSVVQEMLEEAEKFDIDT
ncbi:tRNA dihydrouridine synthase DusB [uncultured Megasphaera sp.]|uniref:tRNA dihydrouridine synthase DusB n=1 Tax=uncultured Megasphaera sp. TaxID=165188 RepID=UPI0025984A0C|nr:tRNA dihydrouridine synthase DusB [uncultured Megasphaera sp.]